MEIYMVNKYMKRCTISFFISIMQIETTWDATKRLLEWVEKIKLTIPSANNDWKQLKLSYIASEHEKC